MNIVLVHNPKSGSALPEQVLHSRCIAAGITIKELIPISSNLKQQLQAHIANGSYIAVIGGDGTISTVAGLIAGSSATLLPLPGGTLNHFTKDLRVPQDLDQALSQLKIRRPRYIDIASVDDTYFVNNSSLGIYPLSLRTREEYESYIGKWPAAIIASWRALIRFKTYRVTIKGQTFQTPFIFIGNNRYSLSELGGTMRDRLDEGILTVYAVKTRSRLELLKIALMALFGKAQYLQAFSEHYPTELTIEMESGPLSVSHDGEVSRITPPLTYRIHSRTLRILA